MNKRQLIKMLESRGSVRVAPLNEKGQQTIRNLHKFSEDRDSVIFDAVDYIARRWDPDLAEQVIQSSKEGKMNWELYNEAAAPFMEPRISDVEEYIEMLDEDDTKFFNMLKGNLSFLPGQDTLSEFIDLMLVSGY